VRRDWARYAACMSQPTDSKAALRRAAAARRKPANSADLAGNGGAGRAARDRFLAADLHAGAEVISGYCPIRTEIDPTPLMAALHAAGRRLCVPVIQGRGQPLTFREWRPDAELVTGNFGARVPVAGDWLEPNLLIVPLLAFDAGGGRLGYGGGFYDRTLAALRAKRRVVAVGFAYAAQQFSGLPREATDEPLDIIVTEQALIRPQAAAV